MATEKQYLESVQGSIEKELNANIAALPQGFDKKRFALNCIAVIRDNTAKWKDTYKDVDHNSIITAFVKGAFLDLDFFNKECYIIPYKNEANFQTDYKGEIKLAKKYSKRKIKEIYAKNVRKGDFFQTQIKDGIQSFDFKPEPFNDAEIIGTFAVVLFEDGGLLYESMSKDEIEKIRNAFSKAPKSPAWQNATGEMYKKTVIRRLLKMIDLSFDNIEQADAFRKGADSNVDDPVVIDGEPAREVVDPFIEQKPVQDVEAPASNQTSETIPEPPQEAYDQINIDSLGV